MNIDYRFILKAGTIGLLAGVLINQVKELIQAVSDQKQIKKAEVKLIEDVSQDLVKIVKSRLNLLKLKPYYFQTQTKSIKIRSAMRYKYEPSDKRIVEMLQKKLASRINEQLHQYEIPVMWYAKIQHSPKANKKNYSLIQGFGEIKGDFFDIKKQYIPQTKLSYWSRFFNWIYQRAYKSSMNIEQSRFYSLFLGPVVGILKYDIGLMKDVNIIAVCTFQNGRIIPTVTATSKSQILTYYQNLINQKYIQVAALIVGTIFFGRWIWSDFKKYLNAMKVRKNKANFQYFNMQNVTDDKMCIICYNHVRNMIFFDCRHMIMCRECSETYDSDVCPYCKMEIDDIKPVIGIP